jgi:hypothetical protein
VLSDNDTECRKQAQYTERHYAERRYAECRSALTTWSNVCKVRHLAKLD